MSAAPGRTVEWPAPPETGGDRDEARPARRIEEGLLLVGVSHHTAPLEIRERLALDAAGVEEVLAGLESLPSVAEAVVLSTCNRTEAYVVPAGGRQGGIGDPDPGAVARDAERVLARCAPFPLPSLEPHLFRDRGPGVARHLFQVAAGVDSLVLGEAEIQGQVREALERATRNGIRRSMAGPVAHRLFEMALRVGGRVRSETGLGRGSGSVASVAVDLARRVFGPLRGRRVLVVGAGAHSELLVRALVREGVRGGIVVNRNLERATPLAALLGGIAVPLEDIAHALRDVDIVLCSTASRTPLLTHATFRDAFPRGGPRRPLLLIDLAVPRDVDPSIGDLPDVFLYNVDDLQSILDEHRARREEELPAAHRLVEDQLGEFLRWWSARSSASRIRLMRAAADRSREEELERVLRRLPGLTGRDREEIEAFSRRLANKILHGPTRLLREQAGDREGTGGEEGGGPWE